MEKAYLFIHFFLNQFGSRLGVNVGVKNKARQCVCHPLAAEHAFLRCLATINLVLRTHYNCRIRE